MGLSQIDDEDLDNERKSIEKLFKYSDTFDSTVFNSGAGSGKTYALIECLKYIISCHREDLKSHNQKIILMWQQITSSNSWVFLM